MTILVTGAEGGVGSYFRRLSATFDEPLDLVGRPTLDVADDQAVRAWFDSHRYRAVVNLAAATDLDKAELDPQWAERLNVQGALHLARASAAQGATLVQISSVAIFGADSALGPFGESDPPKPCNVYARTKVAAEEVVARFAAESLIVRTAWVMGGGANDRKFVGKVRERILAGANVRAVTDQIGSLTYARDLVVCIRELIKKNARGIVHVTNRGAASRYDIATEMVKILGSRSTVEPARASDFVLPARRPPSEASLQERLKKLSLEHWMPEWEDALARYLRSDEF